MRECWETKKSWNRRGLPNPTIEEIFGALFTRIQIIETEEYATSIGKAYRIMKPIDEEDTAFLALALHLDCPIWSNAKHFKRQKYIKTYTTRELARVLGLKVRYEC